MSYDAFIRGQDEPRVVRVTWPTLVGGTFDGRPVPSMLEEDSAQCIEYPVEQRDESWDGVNYVLHRPTFEVAGRVIRVTVLAHESMTFDDVAWHLLCRGLGVPESSR